MPDKRTTKKHPNECYVCEGFGDTQETRPETIVVLNGESKDGQLKTIKIGSGCPKCHGTGRL